jgi:hypothetical protein
MFLAQLVAIAIAVVSPHGGGFAHPEHNAAFFRTQPAPLMKTRSVDPLRRLEPTNNSQSNKLAWPVPLLASPAVITVRTGMDPDHLILSTDRDYVLKLPRTGIHGTLEIDGGHNISLVGGQITVPATANQTDNGVDDTDTGIYIKGSTGIVHIEGVLIKANPNVMFDGIDINAPQATVEIENVRMDDVYGSYSTEHADVVQTWGGVARLLIDNLSADGDYQGLTISPSIGSVGSADIENVDLTDDPRPASLADVTVGGGIMIWLTRGTTTCQASPVTFKNVYVTNLTQRILSSNTVWPPSTSDLPCAGHLADSMMSWPTLPVHGFVNLGPPPDGPFVPNGVAGSHYRSPGY